MPDSTEVCTGMSHGLLADNVDTSLASYSCTSDAVLSEVRDLRVSRERRVKLTRCLSAVAELFVTLSRRQLSINGVHWCVRCTLFYSVCQRGSNRCFWYHRF